MSVARLALGESLLNVHACKAPHTTPPHTRTPDPRHHHPHNHTDKSHRSHKRRSIPPLNPRH